MNCALLSWIESHFPPANHAENKSCWRDNASSNDNVQSSAAKLWKLMFAALQVSSLETCLQRCKSIWGNFATKCNQVIYTSSGYSTLTFGTAHLGFLTMLMEHTTVASIGTQQEFSRSSPGALAAALARCCGAAKPTRWRPDFTVLPGKQTTMLKRLNNSCLLNKQTEKNMLMRVLSANKGVILFITFEQNLNAA